MGPQIHAQLTTCPMTALLDCNLGKLHILWGQVSESVTGQDTHVPYQQHQDLMTPLWPLIPAACQCRSLKLAGDSSRSCIPATLVGQLGMSSWLSALPQQGPGLEVASIQGVTQRTECTLLHSIKYIHIYLYIIIYIFFS